MACCLTAPSHYLNQRWLRINMVLWHSPKSNFTVVNQATILYNQFENYTFKIRATSPGPLSQQNFVFASFILKQHSIGTYFWQDKLALFTTLQHIWTHFHSFHPRAANMWQWIGSALVQIMACRLLGTKPLSKPMRSYCQLDLYDQISVKF